MQTHEGKRVSVKVGETLDRVTGKVEKVVDTSAKPPELIPN
jgi:Tfp pilus assembly protein PilP